jgi:hypothetical protein
VRRTPRPGAHERHGPAQRSADAFPDTTATRFGDDYFLPGRDGTADAGGAFDADAPGGTLVADTDGDDDY